MPLQRFILVACLLGGLTVLASKLVLLSPAPPVTVEKNFKSKPLPAVPSTPSTASAGALRVAAPVATLAASMKSQPRTMKLLLIAAVETEPSYLSLRSFLDTLSIPYEVFVAAKPGAALPPLSDSTTGKGNYQGILLASGNLGVCDTPTTCRSALSPNDWTALDNYSRDFGVRTVSYYTFPEARYGIAGAGTITTDVTPASMAFTPAAAPIFPYLNRANPLPLRYAYAYLATPAPAIGETTTPILTINGATAGVLHTKADGREYMALTFDNNPFLVHSLALNYGILNWVTGGVFIGSRKIYMTPQVDDHFLPNDQYVDNVSACKPSGFQVDPTVDPTENCPTVRIAGADLRTLANWQASWNAKPQFKNFRVSHAYNGVGTTPAGGGGPQDSLVLETLAQRNAFIWINHTWDHENLDCFKPVPNSGGCPSATFEQSLQELTPNIALAPQLGLAFDSTAMVTPNISGLRNPEFLRAAVSKGIKYLVSDSSQPDYLPATPNTGLRNTFQPSILMIPRRPTNVYYNTSSGLIGAIGSLPDEYNYFYGPNGIFRIGGGSDGPPFFTTIQTYNDIIQRESDNLLSYMLRYEMYPQMYHQSNLLRYQGNKSLFSDVIDATFTKFSRISNLPVLSMAQTALGQEIESRMDWLGAGVEGTLTPGVGISLKASKAADVPVTGVWTSKCETYGGQKISKVRVAGTASVALNASGACPASASIFPRGGTPTGIPPAATLGPVTATSSADFNKTAIAKDSVIWFSAIVRVDAKKTDTVIEFKNGKIQLLNSSIVVPEGSVRFDPKANAATTTYTGARWETVVPADFKEDTFITGIPVRVTGALPGGIKDVTWTVDASASGDVKVEWTWSAAVYTSSFPAADFTKILPKPVKGDKYTNYDRSHDAGTPEGALNFLLPGATGDGKKDYVGKASKKVDIKF